MRVLAVLCLLSMAALSANAQVDGELTARARLFPGVGAGVRAVRRGTDGNYYVLTAPGPAVSVFNPSGKLVRKIPDYNGTAGPQAKELRSIVYGEDLAVDANGTVYVADRGAKAVKIWEANGSARMVAVESPVSVAALPEGEVAVATLREPHLVIVFDKKGRDVREFGDPEALAVRNDLNRFLSVGQLATDGQGRLYYAFEYLPRPLVRQYDRYGYAGQEIEYTAIDALTTARAVQREIDRQEKRGDTPKFKQVLTAAAVDAESGEVWMALHNTLLHFDKDGNRRASYLLYTPDGARLEASTIFVDTTHLIIGGELSGIYEFERPAGKTPETIGENKK